jgi:hypothetical protein
MFIPRHERRESRFGKHDSFKTVRYNCDAARCDIFLYAKRGVHEH